MYSRFSRVFKASSEFHNAGQSSSSVFLQDAVERDYSMEIPTDLEACALAEEDSISLDPACLSSLISQVLEQAVSEIVAEFEVARQEREALFENSPEWQKLTGEMLAYARATALLQMRKDVSGSARRSPD